MAKRIRIGICFLAIFFSAVGVSSGAAEKGPIKIGVLLPKTGLLAEHGRQGELGCRLAIEELNAKGGVLGRKLEAVYRDDQMKAEVAGRETNALIFDDKVDALLANLAANTATAASAVAREQKTPIIVYTTAASLTSRDGHRYVFGGCVNNVLTSKGCALTLQGKGFRTAWTAAYDYTFGHQYIESIKSYMAKKLPEIKIIGESWFPLNETDFTGYISQMMRAKPDVAILSVWGTGIASFVRQGKPVGFFDKLKVALDCNPENLRPIGLDFPKGILGFAFYDLTIDNPNNKVFVKNFKSKFGEYPSYSSAEFYTGVLSLAKAMELAKTTDKEAVVDALKKIKVSCPFGESYYRPCDNQGSWPVVIGETSVMPGEKWLYLGTNPKTLPAEGLWASCEEVMAERKAAQKK